MSSDPTPYVQVKPGDVISADLFNTVQADIKTDIAQQIATSIGGITTVKHAGDADTLAGSTIDQLSAAIVERIKALIPGRTGYVQTFNRLELNREKVIKHGLAAMPVVDVYQLEYFPVVQVDDANSPHDYTELYVNFYLYHESEQSFRIRGSRDPIVIEDLDRTPFRLLLKDVLALYKVDTSKDTMTLDELEANLWDALFASPSDRFGQDQYARSPWWEKCCGEKRTIKDLKDDGHWDKLRLKFMPRKTINWPTPPLDPKNPAGPPLYAVPPALGGQSGGAPAAPTVAPTQIQVVHFDLNTIGITLLDYPVYPLYPPGPGANADGTAGQNSLLPPGFERELKVMVVLKA